MITREQLKVGETYTYVINESVKRTVKFIGDGFVLYDCSDLGEGFQTIINFLHDNNLIPKPKKRYWLWDAKSDSGAIFKPAYYMNEDGRYSNGAMGIVPSNLLKKHENEFIEVESN